jgi:hypothetical protein
MRLARGTRKSGLGNDGTTGFSPALHAGGFAESLDPRPPLGVAVSDRWDERVWDWVYHIMKGYPADRCGILRSVGIVTAAISARDAIAVAGWSLDEM